MKKLILIIIMVAATFVGYGFQGQIFKATTGGVINSDMPATNFTNANLTGADLVNTNLR